MDAGEKKRKLHKALLEKLYPQPSQQQQEQESEDESLVAVPNASDLSLISGADVLEGSSSSTSCDEDECTSPQKKLTRAQRKRLRKKKLKEAASSSRRRKIIGPLLLSTSDEGDGVDVPEDCDAPCTIEVIKERDARTNKRGEAAAPTSQSKLKHRRAAKCRGRNNKVDCSSVVEDDAMTSCQVRISSCGDDGTAPH